MQGRDACTRGNKAGDVIVGSIPFVSGAHRARHLLRRLACAKYKRAAAGRVEDYPAGRGKRRPLQCVQQLASKHPT